MVVILPLGVMECQEKNAALQKISQLTCYNARMNWTSEYPTQPGYYWLRHAIYQAGPYECMPMSPQVVEVSQFQYTDDDGIRINFLGDSTPLSRKDFTQAEWFGPIQPP